MSMTVGSIQNLDPGTDPRLDAVVPLLERIAKALENIDARLGSWSTEVQSDTREALDAMATVDVATALRAVGEDE